MGQVIDLVEHFRRFDGHGNGLIVKGRVRSGKTYLVAIITKMLLNDGFAIITNVRFDDKVLADYPDLYYINDDIGYFEAYVKIPDNKPIVLVWDDIQSVQGFKSTHVSHREGDLLAKFLIFIGKFETNYIYVAHQKYIPNVITEGFDPLIIYKLNRETFYLGDSTLWLESADIRRNCYRIPVPSPERFPSLPIKSKALASFTFSLDLDGLYAHLSRYDIGEDLRRGVTEFLSTVDEHDDHFARLKKLSYKDIYTSLCLKKGEILSDSKRIRDLINPKTVQEARDELRTKGY